ncbi:uridine kinase [Planctomonas sp. JC2975]|uniref:uridine kinase n=1 Tax=Planctomonas sp. JC2975 TaxID=2729626 RepID=UPI0014767210|nr:uridine kinase [Planctomonas sp. JC2975]NNC13271.1 uridine kinase [Planctomonas sp. JC2975]
MQLATTPRTAFLRDLRAEIVHNYPAGRVVIAIDGAEGSGTAEFGDDLAAVYREAGTDTARASMRDFHLPRATRHEHGRADPGDYYERSFDYATLRRVLIDPFRLGGSTGFQTRAFDVTRDAPVVSEWQTGPADIALIIDGPFLLRPEISGAWNFSVLLDVPLAEAYARLAASQGRDPDPEAQSNARYVGGWRRYGAEVEPQYLASAVVDAVDPAHPLREYPDTGCACF